jgi:gliding motility associated protien GldN
MNENASLYYPVEATENRKNLFSAIFEAIAQDKVKAYKYLDGREEFTEQYALKFKELLIRFEIPFKEKTDPKKPGAVIFEIDAIDIPTSEVTLFYVKEVMYLDQRNSTMLTKAVALCPVLYRTDEVGETRSHPMFWIPLEALKHFLSGQSIAADSLNSAERLSMYDYFNQRRYRGDIYKVSNLKNQTLWEYCKTPEEIKLEQKRLEKELKEIGNALWEPNEKEVLEAREVAEKEKKQTAGKKPDATKATPEKK